MRRPPAGRCSGCWPTWSRRPRPTAEEVLALLDWRAPRRSRGREAAHREVLAEAARLGRDRARRAHLVRAAAARRGRPRPTSGRRTTRWACAPTSRRGEPSTAVRALDALLPAPVDHFLVQADLTVVVPGPPEPTLAAELEVVAEPESAGGASVHRVTAASVRRALDAGYTADDLHDAVPPPVPYPGAAGADLPGRRRGPPARRAAGRLRRGVPAQRRRGAAHRGAGRPAAGRRWRCAGSPRPCWPPRTRWAGCWTRCATPGTPRCRRTPPARRCWPGRRPGGPRPGCRWPTRALDPLAAPQLALPRLLGVVEQIRRGEAAARAARRAPAVVRGGAARGRPARLPAHGHSRGAGGAPAGGPGQGAGLGRVRRRARGDRVPAGPAGVDRRRLPARRGRADRDAAHLRPAPDHRGRAGE